MCQELCEQDHIIETCGCYEDKDQEIFYHTLITDKKVCRTRKRK